MTISFYSTASRTIVAGVFILIVLTLVGCDGLFTSLGGSFAGDRGMIQVVILNNTDNQAILTLGTFDPSDENTQPDIVQFSTDSATLQLPANSTSSIITFACGRVLGVGSTGLLGAISRNLMLDDLNSAALEMGILFGNTNDNGSIDEIGTAAGFEAKLGTDFSCNSLIILQLEAIAQDTHDFRVEFSFIPSVSDR